MNFLALRKKNGAAGGFILQKMSITVRLAFFLSDKLVNM
jgi:hypothetical protein